MTIGSRSRRASRRSKTRPTIRGRILLAFERAEREADEQKRAALMTFVIVGAGPTGVELAGTIAELARATLPADFRHIDTRKARIVLIEAGPRVLPALRRGSVGITRSARSNGSASRSSSGRRSPNARPKASSYGGKTLAAATIIWAAGVQASPAAQWLDAPADRVGRLEGRARPDGPGSSGDFRHRRRGDRRSARTDGPFRASRRPPSRRAPMSRKSSGRGLPARPRRRLSATSMPATWRRSASGAR